MSSVKAEVVYTDTLIFDTLCQKLETDLGKQVCKTLKKAVADPICGSLKQDIHDIFCGGEARSGTDPVDTLGAANAAQFRTSFEDTISDAVCAALKQAIDDTACSTLKSTIHHSFELALRKERIENVRFVPSVTPSRIESFCTNLKQITGNAVCAALKQAIDDSVCAALKEGVHRSSARLAGQKGGEDDIADIIELYLDRAFTWHTASDDKAAARAFRKVEDAVVKEVCNRLKTAVTSTLCRLLQQVIKDTIELHSMECQAQCLRKVQLPKAYERPRLPIRSIAVIFTSVVLIASILAGMTLPGFGPLLHLVPTSSATIMTLNAPDSNNISAGRSVLLSGVLATSDGNGLSRQMVELQRQSGGWKTLGTCTTSVDGSFTFKLIQESSIALAPRNEANDVFSTSSVSFGVIGDEGYNVSSSHPSTNRALSFSGPLLTGADAGPDQTVDVGAQAFLKGDYNIANLPDGAGLVGLSYSWKLYKVPTESKAQLSGSDTLTPSLTPDKVGEYVVELDVSYGNVTKTDFASVFAISTKQPQAMIVLSSLPYRVGEVISADGSRSTPGTLGDILEFSWTLGKPLDSAVALANLTAQNLSFTPDKPGNYTIRLTVSENGVGQATDTKIILVQNENATEVSDGVVIVPQDSTPGSDAHDYRALFPGAAGYSTSVSSSITLRDTIGAQNIYYQISIVEVAQTSILRFQRS